ncbi:MAG: alpha/beta fold hydrolase [Egibacteraceae bacterium]
MTEIAHPELFDVDVEGGRLRVARWGTGSSDAFPVLAAHGITASHVSWGVVGTQLQDEMSVIVPDLRGRGDSNRLPGPYGMAAHARDLIAIADALGIERAIIAGHSMGGFVATAFAVADPARARAVVLVDGGLLTGLTGLTGALAVRVDPDGASERVLGPALKRLRMEFESREAYREFWRQHPALVDSWSPAVQAYVDYDLAGEPGSYRSKVVEGVVRADYQDMVLNPDVRRAAEQITCPVLFLRAPRGMQNEPTGLYPSRALRAATRRIPSLEVREVARCNHYTIMLAEGAGRVADHIRAIADRLGLGDRRCGAEQAERG